MRKKHTFLFFLFRIEYTSYNESTVKGGVMAVSQHTLDGIEARDPVLAFEAMAN